MVKAMSKMAAQVIAGDKPNKSRTVGFQKADMPSKAPKGRPHKRK
jgi:hypothetical protein